MTLSYSDNVVLYFFIFFDSLGEACVGDKSGSVRAFGLSMASSDGGGGKRRVSTLFRQKDMAGMTGPYTSLNCSARGSPFLYVVVHWGA